MKNWRGLTIAAGGLTLVLAAAACGYAPPDAGASGNYAGAPASSATAPAPGSPVVAVTSAALAPGTALVDDTGRALYLFESDTASVSTCAGTCASVWPPVPAHAGAALGANVGTIQRTDGGTQLTFAGHPLYYYVGDHNPGDTHGQGLDQFGAKWYLVQPSGAELDE